jgi:hypothetical protein
MKEFKGLSIAASILESIFFLEMGFGTYVGGIKSDRCGRKIVSLTLKCTQKFCGPRITYYYDISGYFAKI